MPKITDPPTTREHAKNLLKVVAQSVGHGEIYVLEAGIRPTDLFRLENRFVFASHHKAGTIWFSTMLRTLCGYYGLNFRIGDRVDWSEEADIFFCQQSEIDWAGKPADIRMAHLIRDPRDMLVSACFYHQRAEEAWLIKAQEALDGRTYRDVLRNLPTLEEKLLFEMAHAHRRVMQSMKSWDYHREDCLEIRYEDFIKDSNLERTVDLFRWIGIPGIALGNALTIAYHSSLWPGSRLKSDHVRSGQPGGWKKYFTRSVAERFEAEHGQFLRSANYTTDESWIRECPVN